MDIPKRNSMHKRIPEIDSLYVYSTRHNAPFTQRQQPGEGYRYTTRNSIDRADEGEIYIYHQTVKIDGVVKGITIVTKDKRKTYVQKFFKDSVETIAKSKPQLQIFKEATQTPTQLGIYYSY